MGKLPSDIKHNEPTQAGDTSSPLPPNDRGQTGPRLLSGKAVSSRNATTHGIFSRNPYIEMGQGAESPADFTEILAETRRVYRPEGARQDQLAEHIADYAWRLRRVRRFEVGAIHHRIVTDPDAAPPADPHLDEHVADSEHRLALLRQALAAVRERPDMSVHNLNALLSAAPPHARGAATEPALTGILNLLSGSSSGSRQTAEELRGKVLETYGRLVKREATQLARFRADQERAALEAELRAERERLLYAIPEARDAGLVIRYETMFTRNREKAVKELDQLQAWGK